MIDIVISNTTGKPIYRQIFEQLSAQIIKGDLPRGDLLPPIRSVATQLRVSVITVKKAWEELERAGLMNSMVGRGCFVADLGARDRKSKQQTMIEDKMRTDIAYYKELGLSQADIIAAVKKLYNDE